MAAVDSGLSDRQLAEFMQTTGRATTGASQAIQGAQWAETARTAVLGTPITPKSAPSGEYVTERRRR